MAALTCLLALHVFGAPWRGGASRAGRGGADGERRLQRAALPGWLWTWGAAPSRQCWCCAQWWLVVGGGSSGSGNSNRADQPPVSNIAATQASFGGLCPLPAGL
jgi:hypothetical protein